RPRVRECSFGLPLGGLPLPPASCDARPALRRSSRAPSGAQLPARSRAWPALARLFEGLLVWVPKGAPWCGPPLLAEAPPLPRPRKRQITLTLLPDSRNLRELRTLNSRSCSSVLGRSLISLTSTIVYLRFVSRFFRLSSYLYFPKSRILQTGGCPLGLISTKSR